MTYPTFDLADPEVTAARRARIDTAAQARSIRSRDMAEARALQRKSRIQTARELFDAIANLTASIDGTAQTAALREVIDWLDDGNRMLSDACAADVKRARESIARATGASA